MGIRNSIIEKVDISLNVSDKKLHINILTPACCLVLVWGNFLSLSHTHVF